MGLFGSCEHCADMRAQRDRAQHELSAILSEHAALLTEVLALKRHDLGMPPVGTVTESPASILGPKTVAAIELQSGGFADLMGHLTNWAIGRTRAALAVTNDKEAVDEKVADEIRQGETG